MDDNIQQNENLDDSIEEPMENESTLDAGNAGNTKVTASAADFDEFDEINNKTELNDEKLDMLKDLQLNVYIELGRTQMQIKEVLELERGYVIELEKLASEPVDVFVNNKKIAEGEVVVIDKHFGIRITNLNENGNGLKDLY